MTIEKKTAEANAALNEWLEDVLAGLLAAGVPQRDIEVRRYLMQGRVAVYVRGEQRYEWKLDIGKNIFDDIDPRR